MSDATDEAPQPNVLQTAPEPLAEARPQASAPPPGRRKAALGFIFVTALLDCVALGVIIPVLPHLIEGFVGPGPDQAVQAAHWIGLFGTGWALMQFFASPILGALSDRFGRRPVLLGSIFGLGLDYVVMALAPTIGWLFLGRLISGATAASFSTCSAYIADVTEPKDRAKSFGLIGAAFGAGFVIGPSLGGLLGGVDPRLPFWVSAGLALLNGLYGLFVLPESLPADRRSPFSWRRANPIGSMQLWRAHPGLLGLAVVYFLAILAHGVMPSLFVLYTDYRFSWSITHVGVFLAASGVLAILMQAVVVRPAVDRLGDRGALYGGLAAGAIGFGLYAFAPTSAWFWAALVPAAFMALFTPGLQALMTRRVAANEQGRLQGANSGLMALSSLIAPTLYTVTFGWAVRTGGPGLSSLPIWIATGFMAAALLLAMLAAGFHRRLPDPSAAPISP